jgi:chromosome segregation ATPase
MNKVVLLGLLVGVHASTEGLSQRSGLRVSARTSAKGNSMIAKVIEMLGDEKDKIKADLAAEGKTMAEYTQWCDDTITELSYGIKSAKTKIADLSATIEDNGAQITALDEELGELGNEIAARTSEMDEANAIREKEHNVFLKAEEEQVAAVEELEQLGVELKKQIAAFAQTPPPVEEGEEGAFIQQGSPAATFDAFLQINSKNKVASAEAEAVEAARQARFAKMRKVMTMMINAVWLDGQSKQDVEEMQKTALVQEDQGSDQEPDAMAAQTAQNEKNLAAFEGLKGKAEESLQRIRDEETKAQNEHNVNMMSLKQAIALAENNVDDAKKEKARLATEKAECEEEKETVEASMAADSKSLKETQHECEATAVAWEGRQKDASAEMAAIEKAKEILSSRVTVLIQVRSSSKDTPAPSTRKVRQALISHFRGLGNKLHSLAMLNLVSVSAQDPMQNVKNLLTELIAKLEKEAKEAADLHAFCQEEKKKTKAAMDKKNMEIEKLNTRIEKASSTKQEQEEMIATNSEEIAAMEKANAEATKIRNEEHENFMKVDSDFTAAAEAVDDAIDALKEYYGDASFLQMKSKDTEITGDSQPSFGGAKKDSAGGIIGILETMGEEFRKTVKENQASEREALKAYEKLMNENKVAIATKEAEIKGAESQIKALDVSIHDSGADLKMASKEKAAIEEYIAKLKPQCEGRVVPYEERKAKRDAEIAGLKEGLAILEEESPSGAFSFMQVKSHQN